MGEKTDIDADGLWSRILRNGIALFVLFHVVAICFMAFPAPHGAMRRSAWKDPSVQNEMHQWAGHARTLGMDVTNEGFQDLLWDLSKEILDVRKTILAPFVPYLSAVGARQSWRMFSAPHRFPSRLIVELKEGGDWEPIYEGRSAEHTWMQTVLDHHRMRRVVFMFGWKRKARSWRRFTGFLAGRAAVDFPSASEIRISLRKFKTPTPQERRGGTQEVEPHRAHSSTLQLKDYR